MLRKEVIRLNQLKIINQNGKLLVDSREIAEMVGKNHADLLRDIRRYVGILGKSKFALADFFIESYYNDSQGKPRLHYFLTRKGCDMVANKMTGEKGVLFTATYVTKFEEMESRLKEQFKLPSTYKEALLQLVEKVEENEKLTTTNLLLEQQVSEMKPKADYTDSILKNKGLVNIGQIAKDYGMSAIRMNELLHELKVQYKQGDQWLLYRDHHDKGYTHSNTISIVRSDGQSDVKMNTKWTQKGRLFIYNLLKSKNILPMIERRDNHERSS